ncbi:SET domain-containing protein-lysine N-methyltransferase [Neolewinella lacunae]|uniref:SET domain-containing protein-lysine N-methyltransferase n=1 Tax=Neolewinella lacunae TaxID=1517758 RepID=A0A923PLP3_9BACT|nr:SET domain-containing protein-lysine N-methyltransferase [Neolewinella lacunae]MBC6993498.1 SET domain-containing protein-lysine N-methyltransferase [Neolewinella lacunae]MDN3636226.1 SET domain-containing protein-lysine N-methyltransferase [Neolewinella lacunae]
MIHPDTELRNIGEPIGYGVFATAYIPEGTIVYVKDSLELVISPTDYLMHGSDMQEVIEKYSYIDEKGNRIVSWDFAKYVNHCCNCNTISTGYGFEIAIRDIQAGEQITDEYGIFNLDREMTLVCGEPTCRKVIRPADFDTYYRDWDEKIKASIPKLFQVDQPLMPFLDAETRESLDQFFAQPELYRSVYALRLQQSAAAR